MTKQITTNKEVFETIRENGILVGVIILDPISRKTIVYKVSEANGEEIVDMMNPVSNETKKEVSQEVLEDILRDEE